MKRLQPGKLRRRLKRPTLASLIPVPKAAGFVFAFVIAFAGLGIHAAVNEPPVRSDRLQFMRQAKLYGNDDFNGPLGSPPSAEMWQIDTGGGGWGDQAAQVYSANPDNIRLDGAGRLVLEARRAGAAITSAQISTEHRFDFQTGMIQMRIKMPRGQGLHPAFWLLGSAVDQVGYPAAGQIDIAKMSGTDDVVRAAVTGPWQPGMKPPEPEWKLTAETAPMPNLSDDFHIYWVRKDFDSVTIGIDDNAYATFHRNEVPAGGKWVQDAPFFVVLNLAVDADWPGPGSNGAMPAQILVDWLRIYT